MCHKQRMGTATSQQWRYFILTIPLTPPQNTLLYFKCTCIQANLTCGNYNNLTYNTNNIQYLPVTVSNATTNVGNTLNFRSYCSLGTYIYAANNLSTVPAWNMLKFWFRFNLHLIYPVRLLRTALQATLARGLLACTFDGLNYDVLTTTGGYGYQTASSKLGSKVSGLPLTNRITFILLPKFPQHFYCSGNTYLAIVSSPFVCECSFFKTSASVAL